MLPHTEAFTQRHFYTHTHAFTRRHFYTHTLLHADPFTHRRFYTQMLLHTDAFRRKPFYTQKLPPQFLTLGHHFARKGCASTSEVAISPQFLTPDHHFTCEIAILLHVWTSKRMNQSSRPPNAMLSYKKYHYTSVFDDRTSFRAKGLRFVPSRWHCPAP